MSADAQVSHIIMNGHLVVVIALKKGADMAKAQRLADAPDRQWRVVRQLSEDVRMQLPANTGSIIQGCRLHQEATQFVTQFLG